MNEASAPPELIVIGVNLAHRSFQADRDQIVQRASAAGVRTMVVTGTRVTASREAVRIARGYPGHAFATAGVHPHDSRDGTPATISELRSLAANDEVVAIGECGLDFNRDFSPRPDQEKWFAARWRWPKNCRCRCFCMSAMLGRGSARFSTLEGRRCRL